MSRPYSVEASANMRSMAVVASGGRVVDKDTAQPTGLEAMRSGISAAAKSLKESAAPIREGSILAPAEAGTPGQPSAPPQVTSSMTKDDMFTQFRSDMRRRGLVTVEVNDTMLGIAYSGPAVQVRDPGMVQAATKLTLVTHGMGRGLYRIYPTLCPIRLK